MSAGCALQVTLQTTALKPSFEQGSVWSTKAMNLLKSTSTAGVVPRTCHSRWPYKRAAIRSAEQRTRGRRSEPAGFTQCTGKHRV